MLLLLVIDGYAMVEQLEQSGHALVSCAFDPYPVSYGRGAHREEANGVWCPLGYLGHYITKVEIIFCLPNARSTLL